MKEGTQKEASVLGLLGRGPWVQVSAPEPGSSFTFPSLGSWLETP